MQGKVYIERVEGGVRFAETENGKLIRYLFISDDLPVGNIYRGKVVRVTGAGAFVDLGREKNGFLSDGTYRAGDFVTVQVSRAENGEKGCLLTEKISLSGKYAVITDGADTKFSRKTTLNEEVRKSIAEKVGKGILFRTAMKETTVDDALEEVEILRKRLADIKSSGVNLYDIKVLYETNALTVAENMSDKERGDFSEVEEQISLLDERKIVVDGVELVFDRTEAMTVIDVNSHLNTTKYADSDSYAYATNLIAVEEVCRQIRLRNIGGLIAVDFVSMKDSEKIERIKEKLNHTLRKDDVMAKAEFSEKFCVALIARTKRYS